MSSILIPRLRASQLDSEKQIGPNTSRAFLVTSVERHGTARIYAKRQMGLSIPRGRCVILEALQAMELHHFMSGLISFALPTVNSGQGKQRPGGKLAVFLYLDDASQGVLRCRQSGPARIEAVQTW